MTSKNNHIKSFSFLSTTIAAALCSQLTMADSSVWKAEKDGKHLYLGGTVHVLSKDDYPLPKEFDQAYKKSAVIYFETDIQEMTDPEVASSMMSMLMAKKGDAVDTVLKPETIQVLEAFLKKRNLTIEMFDQFNANGLYMTLMSMELMKLGMMDAGVDEHFDTLARKDKKTLGQLETIEQQMSFISKMGKGDEDQLILYTLRDLEEMPEMMLKMKKAWRSGNRAEFHKDLLEPFIKDYPQTYKELLVKRNNNWMPKIEALFDTPEIEFVLVGVLHMIGKDGLLQQLERRGYKVKPFENEATN